jgi:toxin ParE1/3/4
MDQEIVWLPEARDDLAHIAAYIAANSERYADVVVRKLLLTARELRVFPLMGRVVPEVPDVELRERLVYQYRLIYHVREDQITIIAVIHGARLLLDALGDRPLTPAPPAS